MKTMILSLIFLFAVSLNAAIVGSVSKVDGSVKVKSKDSFKKSKVKPNQEIMEGDLITTSRNGMAVIKLVDGSDVVLDKSSSIHFKENNSIDQQTGKVFYKITSRDAKNSLKVKTPFAIIGIKGTTFTIDTSKDKESVALKEGLIGVASIKEQFKLYRKEILAQYKSFVDDQMSEYEKFKKGLSDPEPEVTKEFDLKAGNVVSFSDNVVKESGFKEKDEAEFEAYEKMINESFEKAKAESEKIPSNDKSVSED